MIASLPMYDRPDTRAANDRLWASIRSALPETWPTPKNLTRNSELWDDWQAPDLLLSQTCGLPYRARLHGSVQLVGTPVHDLPCAKGHYFSVIVVNAADSRETKDFSSLHLAINDPLSQSGWAAPWAWAKSNGIKIEVTGVTGAHQASLHAVAKGHAEAAALDAITWAMLKRSDANAQSVRVLAETAPTPALPYITAPGQDAEALFTALQTAIAALDERDKKTLCLKGLTRLPEADYLAQPIPPAPI